MAFTDDEADDLLEFVSNYCFEDDDKSPISFSVLPIIWNTSETTQNLKKQIYLRGTTDDGLQTVYKPVKAWNFDLSGEKSEISVLSKDNNWMKLQKPRKAFEDDIRSILVTVNFLHLVKKNRQLNDKIIWNKLSRTFSSFDARPSESDLVDCKEIIEEAVRRDEQFTQSEYLMTFLGKKPQKRKRPDEDALRKEKREFIVDDDDLANDAEDASEEVDDGSSEEGDADEEPFDSVCCICDNGGTLLCCEGSCMRSFHATRNAAAEAESECVSLGLSDKEVKAMPNFKCRNCQYKVHQCFYCGQLGSSDKSSGAKVFQCVNATCGYFYHPHCAAKLLQRDSEGAAKELQDRIFAGESFTCPLHICFVCRQQEDKSVPELKMAVCRRCPKAYHEKCLPRKISFEEDQDQGIIQRAWRELLVDRILIYCIKHEIIDDLGTPERNHIKFPNDGKKRQSSVALKNNFVSNKKKPSAGAACQTGTAIQTKKKAALDIRSDKRTDQKFSKLKGAETSSYTPAEKKSEKKLVLTKVWESGKVEDSKTSSQQLALVKHSKKSDKLNDDGLTKISKPCVKKSVPQLDSDSEKRILALMEEASSIITLDDVIDNHNKVISARSYKQRIDKHKSITHGKVEGSCEAVRAAVKKLNGGGTIEDAKAICEPKVLEQIAKWKSELRVYLAPFLYGMRYTSYGRHFTKIDKLKEIVEKMHWYVNSSDMIVDFCCGANDFSVLMKQKLDETGKACSFKNYDLFRPKNDFSFETRNWMDVQPSELCNGSELIIGLNPPFGVKASLANQFIDKALQFKPKLLILIVPPETKRLDQKKKPYDLIWEDTEKLSGKSFYLPGSVDVNAKQMDDWNVVAPVLYLWSRPDWTSKHKAIALKQDHLRGERKNKLVHDSSSFKRKPKNKSTAKKQKNKNAVVEMKVTESSPQPDLSDLPKETAPGGAPENLESRSTTHNNNEGEKHEYRGEKDANEILENSKENSSSSRKRKPSEEKHQTISVETAPEHKRWQPSPSNADHRRSVDTAPEHKRWQPSPTNADHRRSVDTAPEHKQWQPSPSNADHRRSVDAAPEHKRWQSSPSNADHRGRHSSFTTHHGGPCHSPVNPRLPLEEGYSFVHQGAPSNVVEMRDPGYEQIDLRRYEASYRRGSHDGNQAEYNNERVENYHHQQPGPYSSVIDRYSMDTHRQSSEFVSAYQREPERHSFSQLRLSEPELRYASTYSMDSTYSQMNYVPATERYNPRLDEQNQARVGNVNLYMPQTAGVGSYNYNYNATRPSYPGGPMGPMNYRPHNHNTYDSYS